MSDGQTDLLRKLKKLGEVDGKLAGIISERKQLEEELSEKRAKLDELKQVAGEKTQAHEERNLLYRREEKHLKEAQQKLIERRKALASVGDYKTQMAAEREIEAVSKQLGVQEENLIGMLENVEQLGSGSKTAEDSYAALLADVEKLEASAQESLVALEEQSAKYTKERESLAADVDPKSLRVYRRVRGRFPTDPVVPVKGTVCGGCFFELGPQTQVDISRGIDLVRCRSCKRILFLEEEQEESGE